MKKVLFIISALLSVVSVEAHLSASGSDRVAADPELRSGVLESGLTYYIRHNAKPRGQADFYILSDVGAIQEDDDQQGLAHFLEHMAFNGTRNMPGKEIINYLESVGVKFGANLNASTSWDYTLYMMKDVPVQREIVADSALMILHDWAGFIEPQPDEIDKERGVIKEELRTRDNAGWRSTMALIGALGRGTKYEHRNLIGYLDGLDSFEPKSLTRFYHDWYTPDHQAIIVVGDVDVDRVEQQIIKQFADLPPAAKRAPRKEQIYTVDNDQPIVEIYADPEMSYSSVAYFIKRRAESREEAATIASQRRAVEDAFISTMQSARMAEVAMAQDAPILGGGMDLGRVGIIPTLSATTYSVHSPEGGIDRALAEVVKQMEQTREYGFGEAEFERARQNLMSSMRSTYLNREDRTNNSFIDRYVSNYRYGTPVPSAEEEWRIDSTFVATISLADVNRRVSDIFSDDNHVVMVNLPRKEGLPIPTEAELLSVIDSVKRAKIDPYDDGVSGAELLPERAALSGSSVVATTHNESLGTTIWQLANGIVVEVKPTMLKADEVQFAATAEGGGSLLSDDDYRAGQYLKSVMLSSGLSDFDAIELDKVMAGKRAGVSLWVGGYQHGATGYSSPSDLESLMQLLYLNFTAPRFAQEDLDVFKRRVLSSIENQGSDPQYLARKQFVDVAYGGDIRELPLSVEDVDQWSLDQFSRLHGELFSDGDNFRFTFVGNVDLETLKPLVERYIGSIPTISGDEKMRYKDDDVRPAKGVVRDDFNVKMEQPKVGVQRLIVREGVPFTLRGRVVAAYLKAALDDRLLESVREELGGTYGVGVSVSLLDVPYNRLEIQIAYDTNEQQAELLQKTVHEQLEAIASDGVSAERMAKSCEYMVKSFGNSKEHNSGWATFIDQYNINGFDYINDYLPAVEGVTSDDVQQMARELLDGESSIEVVMHPAK